MSTAASDLPKPAAELAKSARNALPSEPLYIETYLAPGAPAAYSPLPSWSRSPRKATDQPSLSPLAPGLTRNGLNETGLVAQVAPSKSHTSPWLMFEKSGPYC